MSREDIKDQRSEFRSLRFPMSEFCQQDHVFHVAAICPLKRLVALLPFRTVPRQQAFYQLTMSIPDSTLRSKMGPSDPTLDDLLMKHVPAGSNSQPTYPGPNLSDRVLCVLS